MVACRAGLIDKEAYLEEIAAESEDLLRFSSDEEECAREVRLAFDSRRDNTSPYESVFPTYQGVTSIVHGPDDRYFAFRLEHNLLPEPQETFVDLKMIPAITRAITQPRRGVSEEYFFYSRKIADCIDKLWLPASG